MSMKVCEAITARIVKLIEEGGKNLKWSKPWSVTPPQNLVSGHRYTGVNRLVTSITCQMTGMAPYFLTAGQAKALGGSIQKEHFGRNYTPVVAWKIFSFKTKNPVTGEEEERHRLVPVRFHQCYSIDQAEGIDKPEVVTRKKLKPIESIDKMLAALPDQPALRRGGDRAFYSPVTDTIQVPHLSNFKSPELEALVRVHEYSHATGAKHRLNRKTLTEASYFGSQTYSTEEITVEVATSWIMAHHGLDEQTLESSSSYLASWISQMKEDPNVLFKVGKEAERIYKYMLGPSLDFSTQDPAEGLLEASLAG